MFLSLIFLKENLMLRIEENKEPQHILALKNSSRKGSICLYPVHRKAFNALRQT